MRKDSGHVVRCFDQSVSFRIFDSTFYFPHSAYRNSAFYQHPLQSLFLFQCINKHTFSHIQYFLSPSLLDAT